MRLRALLEGVPLVQLLGPQDLEITGLSYSSRSVGPGSLFAALPGRKHNGHDFVEEALSRGALAVLSEKPKPPNFKAAWAQALNVREALGLCAANFFEHPSRKMKMVGITGTKGKTTITYLLEAILKKAGAVPGVIGTIEYRAPEFRVSAERTTPEAPDLQRMLRDMLNQGVTHCLIEVSSQALDLKRVYGTSFSIAVFTNLSGEHLDYHETMDQYFEAKKKLFFLEQRKNGAVVNSDDPWGKKLLTELPMRTVTYGLGPDALVQGERFTLSESGIEALIRYPGGQKTITSPLLGKHNLYNILAATAVALALNTPCQAIKEGIASVGGVPGRFEKIPNPFGFQIIVDYAHTESALASLLETVKGLQPNKIILVFGAGGDRDRSKREKMGEVAGRFSDLTILTSDNPRSEDPLAIIAQIEKGLKNAGAKNYQKIADRKEAIRTAISLAKKGDYVLIAGKGHENTQIFKDRTIPFSDQEVARELIKEKETA